MTNSLSQDIYAVGQLMANNLNTQGVSDADVDDGLTTLAGKILNVSTTKISTTLSIDIDSLNLEYGDSFNIDGALTYDDDGTDTGISGASVKLLVGSTVVSTQTTDSNGEVTFSHTPVTVGTHTFKLVYEGDNTYGDCTSSTVTKSVDKETTYLSLTNPSANVTMYSDGTLSISGTLMDNDSTPQPVASKSIVISESGTTITTLTTGNDGSFSGSISGSTLGIGSHTLLFAFVEDASYKGSSVSKTVTVQSPSLSLATDKNVLSYADSESATLTATFNAANVEGLTVSFDVVEGGVVVENIGTDTTDANGQASVTYQSKDAGDLNIQASCNNVSSSSVAIEDIYFYDASSQSGLSHFGNIYEINGSGMNQASVSYDSTEQAYKLTSTGIGLKAIPITALTGKDQFKLSCDIKPTPSNQDFQTGIECIGTNHSASGLVLSYQNNNYEIVQNTFLNNAWNNQAGVTGSWSSNNWYTIEMTVDGTDISIVVKSGSTTVASTTFDLLDKSNTLFNTLTDRQYGFAIGWKDNATLYSYVKNIKIELL